MKYKDYYATLGVAREAGQDAIKKAYRRLAHKFHPDVSKEPNAEERFKEIAEAYETLGDPEKRRAYDELGTFRPGQDFTPPPDWSEHFGFGRGFGGAEDVDLADLFEMLGGRRATRGRARGGQDLEVEAVVTLEEAFTGVERRLELAYPEADARGILRRVPREVRVRIPPGVTEGQRLRVRGRGGAGRAGAPPGDLYLHIRHAPHPLFRADGRDLYVDLPVTPAEAVLGARIELPTLDGKVALQLRPGTQTGQKLRLAGKGLPAPKGEPGDLYAVVRVVVPAEPTEAERRLYGELARAARHDPRSHFPT